MPSFPLPSFVDAGPLDSLARALDLEADALRRRAHSLLAATSGADWQSSAADAFRGRVDDLARQCAQAATRCDDAAASTRAHAATVRRREQLLESAVAGAWHEGTVVAVDIVHGAGRVFSAVGL